MISHYIYYIASINKVGCTRNLLSRMWAYKYHLGFKPEFEILEELHDKTDQEAGDIEWQWADRFDCRRGVHYTKSMKALNSTGSFVRMSADDRVSAGRKGGLRTQQVLTPEQKKENSRKGGKIGGSKNGPGRLGRAGWQILTLEQRIKFGRMGVIKDQCPHCGLESNRSILHRWHFDNCPQLKVTA
jgi:hypothetical protein